MVNNIVSYHIAPPSLPTAPVAYDERYVNQLNNILRLFFNNISTSIDYLGQLHTGTTVTPTPGGGGSWAQTADELALGIYPTDTSYPPFYVRRYGASTAAAAADNLTAFQTAFTLASSVGGVAGGATVIASGGDIYNINGAITVGSFTGFDGNNCCIVQTANNTPVFKLTLALYNQHIAMRDFTIQYAVQQTAAHPLSYGIQLSAASTTTWEVLLENIQVWKGAGAVSLPTAASCYAFLVTSINVVASSNALWGFDIYGDATGANTNFSFTNCWAVNQDGAEISTARGFRIRNTHGVTLNNCGCDHINNIDLLFVESCRGLITTFWAESCAIAVGTPQPVNAGSYFTFSNSSFHCNLLHAVDNSVTITGNASFEPIYVNTNSVVNVDTWFDSNTTVSGSNSLYYFSGFVDVGSFLNVVNYITGGVTPAVRLGDNNYGIGIKYWNKQSLEYGAFTAIIANLTGATAPVVRWVKNGNAVTLRIASSTGGDTSGTGTSQSPRILGLPAVITPVLPQVGVAPVIINSVPQAGLATVDVDGSISFTNISGVGTGFNAASCGFKSFTMSYTLHSAGPYNLR